ncbi:DUF4225 domain-containing protein [Escherichia coli]
MINISLLIFFEEHGLIKYVNLSFDIVASVGQVVGGVGALKFGKVVHSNRIKGIGVTLVAHGANNFYESLSPLFFNGIIQVQYVNSTE